MNSVAAEGQLFTGEVAGAPPGCDIPVVVRHWSEFVEAVNAGAAQIAERFFTDGTVNRFHWFSFTDRDAGGPGHFETFTPDSLNRYFAFRHKADDRFALRGARFIGYDTDRGTVSFSPVLFDYYVVDPATETRVLHYGMGKGDYHCTSGRFALMSLGAKAESHQWSSAWANLETRNDR